MFRELSSIHAQTTRDLGLAKENTAPLSSGRVVPRVTITEVTPFIPRERTKLKR